MGIDLTKEVTISCTIGTREQTRTDTLGGIVSNPPHTNDTVQVSAARITHQEATLLAALFRFIAFEDCTFYDRGSIYGGELLTFTRCRFVESFSTCSAGILKFLECSLPSVLNVYAQDAVFTACAGACEVIGKVGLLWITDSDVRFTEGNTQGIAHTDTHIGPMCDWTLFSFDGFTRAGKRHHHVKVVNPYNPVVIAGCLTLPLKQLLAMSDEDVCGWLASQTIDPEDAAYALTIAVPELRRHFTYRAMLLDPTDPETRNINDMYMNNLYKYEAYLSPMYNEDEYDDEGEDGYGFDDDE